MSDADVHTFRTLLRAHGYRVTDSREATFKLLVHPEPQSMREIIKRGDGSVDRVSVYRNIELFEKLGIVNRIYIGWKYKLELSDDFVRPHHHLTCLGCGNIIDIKDEAHIDEFIAELATRFDFQPRRHQFEIDGYCKNCRVKQANQVK